MSSDWIEHEDALQSFIRDFFHQLYTLVPTQNCDKVLSLIPLIVTPTINDALLSPLY